MKKCLFIVNSLGGGGAERVCLSLARELEGEYSCDFVTLYDREDYRLEGKANLHCLGIDAKSSLARRISQAIRALPDLNCFLREREEEQPYELITSHLPFAHIVTRLSSLSERAGYVMHGPQFPVDRAYSRPYRFAFRLMYRGRKIIAVSSGVKDELVQHYRMPSKCIEVIHNPVYVPALGQEGHPLNGQPYFLMACRLTRQKRVDRAIEVFERGGFREKYKLVVIGEGELRSELEERIRQAGLKDDVLLLGFQGNPAVWMRHASLYLSTSDYEAFPVSPVEALLCGAKVVHSDCRYGPSEIMVKRLREYLVSPIDDIDCYVGKIRCALERDYPFDDFDYSRVDPRLVAQRYIDWACGCDDGTR